MGLEKLLGKKTQVVAVVDDQWGDTGKGKVVDVFAAEWADVVFRGTGGNNAGHTLVVKGKKIILHLLNAGVVYDKTCILGNGMVIDPESLVKEMDELAEGGYNCDKLMLSRDAHVIMPYHIEEDQAKNKSLIVGIGSTGRGIGPCYTDKIARRGIMIRDLFDKDVLARRIKKVPQYYPTLRNDQVVEEIIEYLQPFAARIKPYVRDTNTEIHSFLRQGKKLLGEGAQGLLLSIEYGTYPYVTSSDPSINGTAAGAGLSAKAIDLVLEVVKFPFMTRVGAGPFPTELAGPEGEKYCQDENRVLKQELMTYDVPFNEVEGKIKYDSGHPRIVEMMNSEDELRKAAGIRLAAGEFGATTGRPRRIGWTDLVSAKYAHQINGGKIIFTKADCLAGMERFWLGFGYFNNGKERKLLEFDRDAEALRKVIPAYNYYPGYGSLEGISNFKDLPLSLKLATRDFEDIVGGSVVAISNGPSREDMIFRGK